MWGLCHCPLQRALASLQGQEARGPRGHQGGPGGPLQEVRELKAVQTLSWKHTLGLVTVDVELADHTLSTAVAPLQAVVLLYFQDQASWTLEALSQVAKILQRRMSLWPHRVCCGAGGAPHLLRGGGAAAPGPGQRGAHRRERLGHGLPGRPERRGAAALQDKCPGHAERPGEPVAGADLQPVRMSMVSGRALAEIALQ